VVPCTVAKKPNVGFGIITDDVLIAHAKGHLFVNVAIARHGRYIKALGENLSSPRSAWKSTRHWMLARLFKGLFVGLLAAAGAYSLGADNRAIAVILAMPVIIACVDLMASAILSLFVLFGVGALLWSFTPLGHFALDALNNVAPQFFARPSPS
jgi:hypothetical protein